MLLPEAEWGRGEALAISESCWDPFKVPWSFRQSHLDGNHMQPGPFQLQSESLQGLDAFRETKGH